MKSLLGKLVGVGVPAFILMLGLARSGAGQSGPVSELPDRFSYAAKFVCGWQGYNPFGAQPVVYPHTEPGNYATIVNIHNPWQEQVNILKKVVVSGQERQPNETPSVYPTKRFKDRIQSDQSMSVDCPEIVNLLALSPPPGIKPTGGFFEGFLVVEAFFPDTRKAAELDVVTVTTTAAFRRRTQVSTPPAPPRKSELPALQFPSIIVNQWEQISLDHEVTIVHGRLLAGGKWPDGPPPPPPPQPIPPPGPAMLDVFVCRQLSPTDHHYGLGYLTTHPQFCFDGGPSAPAGPAPQDPHTVDPMVATQTAKSIASTPWGVNIPVYRCNNFNPFSAFYGIGVLTTHPQFCYPFPAVQPAGAPNAATDVNIPGSNWSVGGQDVFRCNQLTFNLGNFYGIGMLTTHPEHCDNSGPIVQPQQVAPSVAIPTGLRVP